jgi:hypothetical protein
MATPVRIDHYFWQEKDARWSLSCSLHDLEFMPLSGGKLFPKRGTNEVYRPPNYQAGTKPDSVWTLDVTLFSTKDPLDDSVLSFAIPNAFEVTDGIARVKYTKGFDHLTSGLPLDVMNGEWMLRETK